MDSKRTSADAGVPTWPDPLAGDVLDHFVSGYQWTIPTCLQILDFAFLEKTPGELAGKEHLAWTVSRPLRHVHAGPGLLEEFLKLESAPDAAILSYARKWGPLWLCPVHDLPWRHDPECRPATCDWDLDDDDDDDLRPEDQVEDGEPVQVDAWYDEPLAGWRALSRQARSTVRLARRLHEGQAGLSADWEALEFLPELMQRTLSPVPGPYSRIEDYPSTAELDALADASKRQRHPESIELGSDMGESVVSSDADTYGRRVQKLGMLRLATSMQFQQHMLAEVVNYWLEIGGVRPRLEWQSRKPAVQLGGDGLAAALAVQLLFDCSRTDGLAVCTSCGTPFLPGPRRPRRDRNAYCSDCGIKAAARDAAARYRQTKKYKETYRKWLDDRRQVQ
jgi:hypothetical protein